MSGIKYLAHNTFTELNIEAFVHMYNIGRYVRSVIFVETAIDCCLLLMMY